MTNTTELQAEAERNFAERIAKNRYPGRGLIVGRASDGAWLQLYWIMGRSAQSRNRRFVLDGGTMRTEPVDPAGIEDPSLIIYEAMLERPWQFLVSNGDQTRTLHDGLADGLSFEAALASREREPDAPNYTPRISALLDLSGGSAELRLSLLRANRIDPGETDGFTSQFAPPPVGFGLGLTTYEGDGDPLPSFRGEPLWFGVAGDPEALLDRYWDALDAENRVALAVKRIDERGESSEVWVRNEHD